MPYKGRFRIKNPNKYLGNPTNIIYRSSWEAKLMKYLDEHPDVINWASEEICIPYRSPLDNKVHRYFPDFYIKRKTKDGIKNSIIEVKPACQTQPPKKRKKTAKFIKEVRTYGINEAKWKAADEYCKDRGWDFKIMTEKELGV